MRRSRCAGEGYARGRSLFIAQSSLTDFCIYAQFDSSFAKLPNLPKSIVKPLESNFWVFSKKKQECITQLQNRWSYSNIERQTSMSLNKFIKIYYIKLI